MPIGLAADAERGDAAPTGAASLFGTAKLLGIFSMPLKPLNNQWILIPPFGSSIPPDPARLFTELGFFNYSTPEQCTVGKMVLFIRCFQRVVERNASPPWLP
jgi:hypothetical protein